jgi:hypothetical protein
VLKGLDAWISKPVKDAEYLWCPIHGAQKVDSFGVTSCLINSCMSSRKYIGKVKDLTELDKIVYGIQDAKFK